MESNKLTEQQLKTALCEVRKAHRLIYEYQRRMQDLSWFIKNKLGFNKSKSIFEGYTRFSESLSNREGNNVSGKSPWDWLYSYVYENFLGYQEGNAHTLGLSVIQITDTGYYAKKGATKSDLSTFLPAEESDTRLMFYMVKREDESKETNMDWKAKEIIEEYACALKKKDIIFPSNRKDLVRVIFTVPLSRFVDEESTMKVLHEFVEYCNKKVGTQLKIQQ